MTENLSRSQIARVIDEWIFNERDRNILKRRLLDGCTFPRISDEFGISERHAKNLYYKGMQVLCTHLPFDSGNSNIPKNKN